MEHRKRCCWAMEAPELYEAYHDYEWGVPLHDDQKLFEMLILEGFQAGLSWLTILKKREAFEKAFDQFDPVVVRSYDDNKVRELMTNKGIVRNRLKIQAATLNARMFLQIQEEWGSFDAYIWHFTKDLVIYDNTPPIPSSTPLSDTISKDLKQRGMKFVGSTIIYAYLQAIGIVNSHEPTCYLYHKR